MTSNEEKPTDSAPEQSECESPQLPEWVTTKKPQSAWPAERLFGEALFAISSLFSGLFVFSLPWAWAALGICLLATSCALALFVGPAAYVRSLAYGILEQRGATEQSRGGWIACLAAACLVSQFALALLAEWAFDLNRSIRVARVKVDCATPDIRIPACQRAVWACGPDCMQKLDPTFRDLLQASTYFRTTPKTDEPLPGILVKPGPVKSSAPAHAQQHENETVKVPTKRVPAAAIRMKSKTATNARLMQNASKLKTRTPQQAHPPAAGPVDTSQKDLPKKKVPPKKAKNERK